LGNGELAKSLGIILEVSGNNPVRENCLLPTSSLGLLHCLVDCCRLICIGCFKHFAAESLRNFCADCYGVLVTATITCLTCVMKHGNVRISQCLETHHLRSTVH